MMGKIALQEWIAGPLSIRPSTGCTVDKRGSMLSRWSLACSIAKRVMTCSYFSMQEGLHVKPRPLVCQRGICSIYGRASSKEEALVGEVRPVQDFLRGSDALADEEDT